MDAPYYCPSHFPNIPLREAHDIWLHLNDPMISLSGAIVNNDEHYIMSTGCMAEELNHNKLELTGIIGDSTFIDVLVVKPSGKK